MKGFVRFGSKGKLAPRYVGPFMILNMVGSVTYSLALPDYLHWVHDVFHMSMLRRFLRDEDTYQDIEFDTIEL